MTALTYIIDRFWKHAQVHDDFDLILDRVKIDCEYIGIDFEKVGRAAFGGVA